MAITTVEYYEDVHCLIVTKNVDSRDLILIRFNMYMYVETIYYFF